MKVARAHTFPTRRSLLRQPHEFVIIANLRSVGGATSTSHMRAAVVLALTGLSASCAYSLHSRIPPMPPQSRAASAMSSNVEVYTMPRLNCCAVRN